MIDSPSLISGWLRSGWHKFKKVPTTKRLFKVFWLLLTFGYRFPHRRKGENRFFCIGKYTAILIMRCACIMGSVWFIINWVKYLRQGDDRPFNMLERQARHDSGSTVPILNIFSTTAGTVNIVDVAYSNKTGTASIPFTVANDTITIDPGEESLNVLTNISSLATGRDLQSIQIVIKHLVPATLFPWTVAGLIHPQQYSSDLTDQDMYNQYFFRPGHFVEIRYTPLHVIAVYRPKDSDSVIRRFKAVMGYGGKVESFSYRSAVDHIPFPEGQYDNMTTVVVIRPQTNLEVISYAEEKVTLRDTLAKIGGLIGFVASVIVYMFGTALISPWGLLGQFPCIRNSITRSLATTYSRQGGLTKGPFMTQHEEIGTFEPDATVMERIMIVKERMDELEVVLSDFFVDTDHFREALAQRAANIGNSRANSMFLAQQAEAQAQAWVQAQEQVQQQIPEQPEQQNAQLQQSEQAQQAMRHLTFDFSHAAEPLLPHSLQNIELLPAPPRSE